MVFAMILVDADKCTATRREADRACREARRTWRHSGLWERSRAVLLYQLQFRHLINNSVSMRPVPSLSQVGAGCKRANGRGITARWRKTSERETTELWERRVCIGACRCDDNCALVQRCTLIGKEKCSRSLT